MAVNPTGLLQKLIAEWNATNQPIQERGNVLPLGTYEDGSVHMAWPEMTGVPAFQRMAERGPVWDASSPEGQQHALDALGVGGSLALGGVGASATGAVPKGAIASNAMGKGPPKGITAYHGSPHDFDRFSLDKIGSGEGAQTYGHGLYFAENEDVARTYREALADPNVRYVGGVEYDPANPQHRAASRVEFHGDAERAKRTLQDEITYLRSVGSESSVIDPRVQELEILESGNVPGIDRNHGRMYQVRINAEPDQFLDWDKPLSGQSEAVKTKLRVPSAEMATEAERLAKEIDRMNRIIDGRGMSTDPHPDQAMRIKDDLVRQYLEIDPTESAWWKFDTKDAVARPESAQKLRDAGIPGIKYLDQGSRGAGEGSSNYVVFDDALIEILKKYSNPPTASLPSLAAGQGEDDQRAKVIAILNRIRGGM